MITGPKGGPEMSVTDLLALAQRWLDEAAAIPSVDSPTAEFDVDMEARKEVLVNCAIALELTLEPAATVEKAKEELTAADEIDRASQREVYIELAQDEHQREGEVEIDDNAKLSDTGSIGEHGVYVAAWVWVNDPECRQCGAPIAPDPKGTWLDETMGDGCSDGLTHTPKRS